MSSEIYVRQYIADPTPENAIRLANAVARESVRSVVKDDRVNPHDLREFLRFLKENATMEIVDGTNGLTIFRFKRTLHIPLERMIDSLMTAHQNLAGVNLFLQSYMSYPRPFFLEQTKVINYFVDSDQLIVEVAVMLTLEVGLLGRGIRPGSRGDSIRERNMLVFEEFPELTEFI